MPSSDKKKEKLEVPPGHLRELQTAWKELTELIGVLAAEGFEVNIYYGSRLEANSQLQVKGPVVKRNRWQFPGAETTPPVEGEDDDDDDDDEDEDEEEEEEEDDDDDDDDYV